MIVKKHSDEILSYLEDASNFREGKIEKVFIPENENDVIEVLHHCTSNKIPLTVAGGGTGTVGGKIPKEGVLISMEKFDKIKKINTEEKTAILESGVIISNFLAEIENNNLFYPPFPTERSAFIGGNIATNASGEYSYRFGPTRKYVKKIRMILTTGEILKVERGKNFEKGGIIYFGKIKVPLPSYRTPQIKCSAGYYCLPEMDAIDLIIGSEGTLGIITEAEVSLIDKLPDKFIMIMFLPSDEKLLKLIQLIKRSEELKVYSLEYFDPNSLEFLKKDFPEIPENSFAIYVEAASDTEKMEKWLEITENFNVVDAWIGEDIKNYERLINFRYKLPENINSYFKKIGSVKVAVDVAVPEENFSTLYNFYREIMKKENLQMILFGHIGENHLHFNFFPKDENEKTKAWHLYEDCVKKGISLGGTVSAEHGIGKIKHKWLKLMYGEQAIKEMAGIKKLFDNPYCILCLDNIFPKQLLTQVP